MRNKTVVRVVLIVVIVVVLGVVAVFAGPARAIAAPAPIGPIAIPIGKCIEGQIKEIKSIGAIASRIDYIDIKDAISSRAINQIETPTIDASIPGC